MEEFNTDNIDKFGHCVGCHRNLITKRIVDGKEIEMFMPDHGHTEFLLSNGSCMQVCMCRSCRENIDLNDQEIHENIMEAVHKGWVLETKALVADNKYPNWTEEFGNNYLDNMKKLSIDCHSEKLDKNIIEKRRKELLEVSIGSNNNT